ncbi:hypothetical protein E4T39_01311 [Aureobasidium subglaciale]|nr:hypothetical protein E4T39_01311 [Aureobasidium subglaciale]
MVVKWTADKDSFILNHLLTSSSIKIDSSVLDEMIASWPESFGDKPTKKAFTEHFSKVRKNNKGLAAGGSPAPSTPSGAVTKKKKKVPATKTPAKRRKTKITAESEDDDEAPLTKTLGKRKKTFATSEEDDEDKEVTGLGIKVKPEPEDEEEEQSPSKKQPARRGGGGSALKYAESEGEASHASDADAADDYKEVEVDAGAEMEV